MVCMLLTLCCVLLVLSKVIRTHEEIACDYRSNAIEQLPAADDLCVCQSRIPWTPFLSTFTQNIIRYFHEQRENDISQFGFLFMGNVLNLKQVEAHFNPQENGRPVIDNSNPISPPNIKSFGNYVASRPINVTSTMVHAERLLIDQLHSLYNAYSNVYHQTPSFILLYSWIMPCPESTYHIIRQFRHSSFKNVLYRVISYTLEGTDFLPYMTPEDNIISRESIKQNGMFVWRERCQRPNYNTTDGPNAKGRTSLFSPIMGNDSGSHVCQKGDAFQGCLDVCLDNNICCSCSATFRYAMKAAMINELTLACATSEFRKCAKSWIEKYIGNASSCIRRDEIEDQIESCVTLCYDRPLSNPLDINKRFFYPDLLTSFSKLAVFLRPQRMFCNDDDRIEGFLCSHYTTVSFTAGNTLCRSGNSCGYHNGTAYSWCYTDNKDRWDYCCTGPCSFGEGTSYQWCRSGFKWQYCGKDGLVDIKGRQCLPSFPCGMHADYQWTGHYWCFVDHSHTRSICCQPGDVCSKKGMAYNWCYTGYKKDTDWKLCEP